MNTNGTRPQTSFRAGHPSVRPTEDQRPEPPTDPSPVGGSSFSSVPLWELRAVAGAWHRLAAEDEAKSLGKGLTNGDWLDGLRKGNAGALRSAARALERVIRQYEGGGE